MRIILACFVVCAAIWTMGLGTAQIRSESCGYACARKFFSAKAHGTITLEAGSEQNLFVSVRDIKTLLDQNDYRPTVAVDNNLFSLRSHLPAIVPVKPSHFILVLSHVGACFQIWDPEFPSLNWVAMSSGTLSVLWQGVYIY